MTQKSVFLILGLLLSVSLTFGQTECSALVEQALQSLDDNCADMSRNTACYGYNQVQASFLQDVEDDFFTQPSDRTDLTYLESIRTTALDEDNDLWGIALMSVQANVPNTLPGQAVVFMLLGDVQVENAVTPDEAFAPAEAIEVTTLASSSNIRLSPTDTGFVVGTAPVDTTFSADGLSQDGQWVRIIYEEQPAWIFRNIINAEASLETLPIIADTNRTPMQAFYFSTGTGASSCNEAPDSLMIQGPNSLEVQINANGVDINIGSTIVLESRERNEISITAVNGYAQVENVRIPGGFTIDAQTDEGGTIQPETLSGLRPMDDEQIERLKTLEKVEETSIVNYRVQVPTRTQITQVQNELQEGQRREDLKAQCQQNGLTQDQCQSIIGGDSDPDTIFEKCKAAGLTERECRLASGIDTGTDGMAGSGASIVDRCRAAGFESEEACRNAFNNVSDDRIDICVSLGHTNQASCQAAFSDDNVDRIASCISRGFATKAECDAADNGTANENNNENNGSGSSSNLPQFCVDRGFNAQQCQMAQAYQQCLNQGGTPAQCQDQVGGGGGSGGG